MSDMNPSGGDGTFETAVLHYYVFKGNQAAATGLSNSNSAAAAESPANIDTFVMPLATAANDNEDVVEDGGGATFAAGPFETNAASSEAQQPTKDDEANVPTEEEVPEQQDLAKKNATATEEEAPGMAANTITLSQNKPGPESETAKNPLSAQTEPATQLGLSAANPLSRPDSAAAAAAAANKKTAVAMAHKYEKVAAVLRQEFPQNASRLPPNPETVAPDIEMRYACYPQLHTEVGFLRQRVLMQDQQLQSQKNHIQQLTKALEKERTQGRKRSRPLTSSEGPAAGAAQADSSPPPRPTKKPMTYKRIANRPDVPDDVKKDLERQQKEAFCEKRTLKKKINRLERKVNTTKEKLDALAKKQAQPPPPPVQAPLPRLSAPSQPPVADAKPPPNGNSNPVPPRVVHTFDSRFMELADYHRANNTCRVPLRIPGLGRWVGDLRRNYKMAQERPETLQAARLYSPTDLTQERIDRLNGLNFEWEVAAARVPWEQRFEEIVAYKEKHGNTLVPRHYKENPGLGEWVHLQRKNYKSKSNAILGERTDKLNSLGFAWSTGIRQKVPWEDRIEQCRNYRRKHGHLKVLPPNVVKGEGESAESETTQELAFRSWCHRQRDQYRSFQNGKKSGLDRKKIRQLEDLGFDFTLGKGELRGATGHHGKPRNEEMYREQVAKLMKVKEICGDCNEMKNIERVFPEDKKLYFWVKTQRKQYKNLLRGKWSSLTEERRLLLEAIDFNFAPRKHYAPYGSKKAGSSEQVAGNAALTAAAEMAAEFVGQDDDETDGDNENSTLRDYEYIHGGSVRT